jgi:plasmid maintenance system killer protein
MVSDPEGQTPPLYSAARIEEEMVVTDKGWERKGQHSIRINAQWRICFVWRDRGAENVEIVDYH